MSATGLLPQTIVRVDLGVRSYDVRIGPGLLDQAGPLLSAQLTRKNVIIVTDETVAGLYLARLERSLAAAGIRHHAIVLPPGEGTKDFAHLAQLTGGLLEAGVERGTTLIALGGGVIGDLAGFAAAITLRGISYVQIPTTLLAQVDSSVGGKTAIDTPQGKNLVGAFHQPRLVLADISTLATLPERQVRAGYAEVAKYGLIDDPAFFVWLEEHGRALVDGNEAHRLEAVATSVRSKAAIVARDERETGDRALLNLGHTFAHALEAETGFGDELLHGEAVAAGMGLAFTLSARLGLAPHADAERVRRHLRAVGLPAGLKDLPRRSWSVDALIGHMRRDKKVRDERIRFVLARGIGKAFLTDGIDPGVVAAMLADELAG
ncbi:MAG: 3-dehydroquinate synthase [Gemmatimonas sp.]